MRFSNLKIILLYLKYQVFLYFFKCYLILTKQIRICNIMFIYICMQICKHYKIYISFKKYLKYLLIFLFTVSLFKYNAFILSFNIVKYYFIF